MVAPLTPNRLSVSVAAIRDTATHIARLMADGWTAEDSVTGFRLIRSMRDSPERQLDALGPIYAGTVDVQIIGIRDGHSLRLRRINERYEVVDIPGVAPAVIFDEANDQERAVLAWERDTTAAFGLRMSWTITVDLDPSLLVNTPVGIEVRTCLFAQTITDTIGNATPAAIAHLTPPTGVRRVYIALLEVVEPVHLGAITFASLPTEPASGVGDELVLPPADAALPGEAAAVTELPSVLPRADALLPPSEAVPAVWSDAVQLLTSWCALSVWSMLASSCAVDGDVVTVEFVGFKRSTVHISVADVNAGGQIMATLRLRAWTFGEASPDRLLAVRQVTSLYEGLDVLHSASDILASAEIIYLGLRTDAVAEVVRSARDAQSQVLDSVRQSLKGAQDMAKSAAERFIATLVGIGGVVIANASDVLTNHVGRELLLLLALFLVLLALFSLLVEGPLLSVALRNLKADLKDGAALLSDDQLNRVTSIPSVGETQRKIGLIRSVIPAIYGVTVLVIVAFGYPSQYK
jgi:hypothetical protein